MVDQPDANSQEQGDKLALKIYLTDEAQRWLWGFVHAVDTEIGGFGYCTSPDPGIIVVDTVLLAPQEVSGAGVDFKDEAMAYMVEKAADDGRLEDARFSWHSHVNMGTYWSNTDEEGIKDYYTSGMPWLVSIVANKRHEVKGRLDVFDVPIIGHATFNNNIEVIELRDNSIDEQLQAEIETFVERKAIVKKDKDKKDDKKDDSSVTKDEGKSKEMVLANPVAVDSTMGAEEYVLWQKFLADENMTAEEEARLDAYMNGKDPNVTVEVLEGGEVVVA